MNKLPDDLLFSIFLLVEPTSLLKLEAVCRAYNTIVKEVYKNRALIHVGTLKTSDVTSNYMILLKEVLGKVIPNSPNFFLKNLRKVESLEVWDKVKINRFPNLKIITGEFRLTFDNRIDIISLPRLKSVGSIKINNCALLCEINFPKLRRVENSLRIYSNSHLASLVGLSNLEYVGEILDLSSNPLLTNVKGLNNLKYVGVYIEFASCHNLLNILDLRDINFVGNYIKLPMYPINRISVPVCLSDKVFRLNKYQVILVPQNA